MKNSLPTKPVIFRTIVLVTCFIMVIFYNKTKAAAGSTSTASHFYVMK